MKAYFLIAALSYVFLTSDGVYTPFRIIAGIGLLLCTIIALSALLHKVTK